MERDKLKTIEEQRRDEVGVSLKWEGEEGHEEAQLQIAQERSELSALCPW